MTKTQKDALNKARDQANQIRKRVETLTVEDIINLDQWCIGTDITNMICRLVKELKAGDKR